MKYIIILLTIAMVACSEDTSSSKTKDSDSTIDIENDERETITLSNGVEIKLSLDPDHIGVPGYVQTVNGNYLTVEGNCLFAEKPENYCDYKNEKDEFVSYTEDDTYELNGNCVFEEFRRTCDYMCDYQVNYEDVVYAMCIYEGDL